MKKPASNAPAEVAGCQPFDTLSGLPSFGKGGFGSATVRSFTVN